MPSKNYTNKQIFFFIDLAANHAWKLSNTLHLEQNGWDGLCIEGSPEYWYDLARSRNCTVFGAFVGGNENEDGKKIEIALGSAFGGIINESMNNKPGKINRKTSAQVSRELVSFSTILQISNSPRMIDYLSLDVEGAETLILKDFPFDQYTFRFMTIEQPQPDLEKLLNYHGYREVMKLVIGEKHFGFTKGLFFCRQRILLVLFKMFVLKSKLIPQNKEINKFFWLKENKTSKNQILLFFKRHYFSQQDFFVRSTKSHTPGYRTVHAILSIM